MAPWEEQEEEDEKGQDQKWRGEGGGKRRMDVGPGVDSPWPDLEAQTTNQ